MVKFSHSLQFNTVPDWANEYIAYSILKKTLYTIEKYNVQHNLEGKPTDLEQGFDAKFSVPSSSEKPSKIKRLLWRRSKDSKDVESTGSVDTALHDGSDIFPPESEAFERGLAKELSKITSFYIRKERELSTELDAVDRQWQQEEQRQKEERLARGGSEEDTEVNDDINRRRLSMNTDEEKQLAAAEKTQLQEMMSWDKDGLTDQDAKSTGPTANDSTVGGSAAGRGKAVAGSDSVGDNDTHADGKSSNGDPTEIVWRRECLIESGDDEKSTKKKSKSSLPISRSQSTDDLRVPLDDSTEIKRTQSHHQLRKPSINPKRTLGHASGRENPNQKPSLYAPLTTEALLRRRIIDTYVYFSELKSYVALNYLGFKKIVKKHDKLAGCSTLDNYMATVVDLSVPFQAETRQNLDQQIIRLQALYARSCTNGSMALAAKELRSHLREYIVWERNTVWRDMVGQERKAEGARAVKEHEPWMVFGKEISFISKEDGRRIILGILGIIIFAVLMNVTIFDTREQNRCFAILITTAYFWATEVFPLFATALLVPLLTVLCQVMRDPTTKATLSTSAATKLVFGYMFSPTIMLLLGGFTIASALSKYGIAKAIASAVLSKAGTDPKWVLLANMFVATVASMFISNVAAPVLCFSLIQSILRTLPHKSSFAPCLIMGIALASNVGGLASPISSPQNIITIQYMNPAPSWGNWFAVSIPLAIIIDLIIWAWLMILWRPQRDTPSIPVVHATKERITWTQAFISLVTIGTIVLWCMENTLEAQLGDMGIIAILPLIAFFGSGLLNKDDFNNFLWTVIMLAMGGIALGKAVDSSGLLDTIAHHIQSAVADMSVWVVLVIFGCLTLVFATFVSHTVAAVIILPIVQQVGLSFPNPHPNILVMGTGLICSCAMGLPVSGFPNMNAIAMEDEMGKPFLRTIDFLKSGVPLSILATLCVVSVGYGIMSALGF
ncbi:low-affinity phosphate transporter [Entomortierella chlamydospora]|uniref:Low-affinity phosphate transporter n=1 Tax=Entomortierella chlamydospora TaxID=101097 RepID=A0A9P6T4J4_9FUNG|nr:low-affinity phosphate transporter [Entomortierella chlamydospora]KAG0024264.1 low-affinity phosphate transporter [Entomortierella chlamydospora]